MQCIPGNGKLAPFDIHFWTLYGGSGLQAIKNRDIYTNADGILNDDKYEYDSIGYPFFKEAGDILYQYELKRKRRHKPDLANFIMDYSKP